MQSQAPGYFNFNDFRSLYWKILPILHRLIQLVISTCVRIDLVESPLPYVQNQDLGVLIFNFSGFCTGKS